MSVSPGRGDLGGGLVGQPRVGPVVVAVDVAVDLLARLVEGVNGEEVADGLLASGFGDDPSASCPARGLRRADPGRCGGTR